MLMLPALHIVALVDIEALYEREWDNTAPERDRPIEASPG
jgi:hypothetical protein